MDNLRKRINRILPPRRLGSNQTEGKLSEIASQIVFQGRYLYPREVTAVQPTSDGKLGTVIIRRTRSSGTTGSETTTYPDISPSDYSQGLKELRASLALSRASRVERFARCVKVVPAIIVAGAVAIGLLDVGESKDSVPSCTAAHLSHRENIIVTRDEEAVEAAQNLGITVCSLGGDDFVITE